MSNQLKPCPFCGDRGRKRTIKWSDNLNNRIDVLIECRNKNCCVRPSTWMWSPKGLTYKQAKKIWNRRVL